MEQIYSAIKAKYPDAVVLVRCDDFYITFKDDAKILKQVCGCNKSFNADRVDKIMSALVKTGYKVAICEPVQQ